MKVAALLARYHMQPSKGLGQSFLRDERIAERIVAAAELGVGDVALEIGPGLGILTAPLADAAGQVIAVELDRRLVAALRDMLGERKNVHLVQGDILEMNLPDLLHDVLNRPKSSRLRYKIVGNLPYYITSAILRHVFSTEPPPRKTVITVQREVAARITALAGDLSLLALGVQVYGDPRILFRVPPGAFYPRPKVDSTVIEIDTRPEPRVPRDEIARFFQVARAGFAQKRKQIHNSLTHNLHIAHQEVLQALAKADIDAQRRPQTLSVEEWRQLARALPLASRVDADARTAP